MAKMLSMEKLGEESQQLFDVLNEESDLAAILIGTSFIDACLRLMLEKKLIKSTVTDALLSHNGRLGSMKARTDMCYVMALISKGTYLDLVTLGQIRNKIAHHHLWQDFGTPEIAELCSTLSMPLTGKHIGDGMNLRDRFTLSVTLLYQKLIVTVPKTQLISPKEFKHHRFDLTQN